MKVTLRRRITSGEVIYWSVIGALVAASLAVLALGIYVITETNAAWGACSEACHARALQIDGVEVFEERCHCVQTEVLESGEWMVPR